MTELKNYWELGDTLDLGTYPKNQQMAFSLTDIDTEERYDKDPPPHWPKYAFNYKYNSYGFRSREFDLTTDKSIILALGCSFTCGVGIPFNDTWSETLGKHFSNHVVYNAGLGGASSDTVARLAVNMIPIIKPDIVVILWPTRYRFETYSHGEKENGTRFNGPWEKEDDLRLSFKDNNSYNNQMKNKLIVNLLAQIYGFTLLSEDLDTAMKRQGYDGWLKARDNGHLCGAWHTELSKQYYAEYLKKRVV